MFLLNFVFDYFFQRIFKSTLTMTVILEWPSGFLLRSADAEVLHRNESVQKSG